MSYYMLVSHSYGSYSYIYITKRVVETVLIQLLEHENGIFRPYHRSGQNRWSPSPPHSSRAPQPVPSPSSVPPSPSDPVKLCDLSLAPPVVLLSLYIPHGPPCRILLCTVHSFPLSMNSSIPVLASSILPAHSCERDLLTFFQPHDHGAPPS